MIRRLAKNAAAIGLRAFRGPEASPLLVLCYHRVVEDVAPHAESSAPAMLVSARMLERQLDWIGRSHRFVQLAELAVRHADAAPAGQPLAAVTFDDGYADFHDVAWPLLQRKGIPAAVFVITDLVGTARIPAHDRLYVLIRRLDRRAGRAALLARLAALAVPPEVLFRHGGGRGSCALLVEHLLLALPIGDVEELIGALGEQDPHAAAAPRRAALDWAMLSTLVRAGVTVGSHTRRHALLCNESPADVVEELVVSKRTLERRLGVEVRHISYPAGQFSDFSLGAAAAAGYRYGYTTCGHRSPEHPLLTIPRRTLWENSCAGLRAFSPAIAACQVAGAFDRLHPCRADHAARRSPPPSAARQMRAS